MNTLWILLVLGFPGEPAYTPSIEFSDPRECSAARDGILAKVDDPDRSIAVCVKNTLPPEPHP